MNKQEELFLNSIKNKIEKFSIKTTVKEVVEIGKNISLQKYENENTLVETKYNNGEKEIVSPGIEWYLCSKSPYYFVKRYGVISVPNIGIIPFDLYYFQQEILKEIDKFKKTVYLKSRQAGISVLMSHYCLWRCLFRNSENIDVVSIKKDKAQDFVSKMKTTLTSLPDFLQVDVITENKSRIEFANKSQITSEPATENAGRSDTLSLLVMDELAFYRSENLANNIVASAMPTLTRTGGAIILISTPNGMSRNGAFYYEQVQEMKIGMSEDEKLIEIDWFEVPDIEGIKPEKGFNKVLDSFVKRDYYNNPIARREMRNFFEPIFKDWRNNEWLKHQHRTLGSAKFEQEIGHNFVIMENAVISKEYQDRIKEKLKEPIIYDRLGYSDLKGLWIWKLPNPGRRYVCGVDVSRGTSKDTSSMEIIDVESYEQVAEYKGYISTVEFSKVIKKIARYYNEAFVVIESNGIGEAVFNGVYADRVEPYYNVFKQKKTRNNIEVMTGWNTDQKSRQLITNNLVDWLVVDELFNNIKIYSTRLFEEITTWVMRDGRMDHAEHSHDDAVFAFALALYNRNRAERTGDSFMVDEKGSIIELGQGEQLKSIEEKGFGIITSESDESDIIERKYGMSKEIYSWLVG